MKKVIFLVVLPIMASMAALLTIGSSCTQNTLDPVAFCDTSNSIFKQLYTNALTNIPVATNTVTLDLPVHEYTFSYSTTKYTCALGYTGYPAPVNLTYKMEIIQATTNAIVFTADITFNTTSKYELIGRYQLTANTKYILRRTLLNNLSNVANNQGRALVSTNFPSALPYTFNGLTIFGTSVYNIGSSTFMLNKGLPFIDLCVE